MADRAVFVGDFKPGSPDWHAARANGIGGSEVASILGLSPFESRFSLWHRKQGMAPDVEVTKMMEAGNLLEPVIIDWFLANGGDTHHPEFYGTDAGTWASADRPWQIVNPDHFLSVPDACGIGGRAATTALEVKFSAYGDGWGDEGTDQIPVHYRTQVIWYGDVFGFDQVYVAVCIGGWDFRWYVVDIDQAEAEMLRNEARAFLDTIDQGVRPNLDEHNATYNVIKHLHPEIDGTDIVLPDELVADYVTRRAALAAAESAEKGVRIRIADHMGDAKRAVWGDFTIASRQARGGGTPYVVASKKLPDLGQFASIEQDAA